MQETYNNSKEYYNALVNELVSKRPRQKPTVHYLAVPDALPLVVGYEACVIPVDHPATYLNGRYVDTSPVVNIFEGGFETRNTRYVLAK